MKQVAFEHWGKGLIRFHADSKPLETDGFEPKGLPSLGLSSGRIGYCKKDSKFYIVRADAHKVKLTADCHSPFAEIASGGEDLVMPEGHFSECTVPGTKVHCTTTKGDIQIQFRPYWAPLGVTRILNLVKRGFYDNIFLWRVNGAIIQFGADQKDRPGFDDIRDIQIADDAHIVEANPKSGLPKYRIAHAGAPVPNSRDVGIFFVVRPNMYLGAERWEAGCGDVVKGQDVIDSIYGGYGEGVDVQQLYGDAKGFAKKYPKLDRLIKCEILPEAREKHEF
jgi:cyclophilin family peptidyl-prolyl cis-trans isomerase